MEQETVEGERNPGWSRKPWREKETPDGAGNRGGSRGFQPPEKSAKNRGLQARPVVHLIKEQVR